MAWRKIKEMAYYYDNGHQFGFVETRKLMLEILAVHKKNLKIIFFT